MSLIGFAAHSASLLLDVFLKSFVLFAVAGLAHLTLRRASAASRHALRLLTLGSLLCLPVFCVCLPHWTVPVIPSVSHVVGTQSVLPETPPLMRYEAAPQEKSLPAVVRTQSQILAANLPITAQPTSRGLGLQSPVQANGPSPANWVVMIWIVGFGACLIWQLIGLLAARRLVSHCRSVTTGPLTDAAEQARRTLGIARPVSIREGMRSEIVAVPMTFGAFRPAVLLGAGAADWPAERLRAVLLHEMAHVRRWDWLTLMLSQATCAVYWFHPLVWLAARRLRTECEEACDDLVLNCGIPAPDYAACLLEIVQGLTVRATPATVAMARRREVGDRLKTILADDKDRSPLRLQRFVPAVLIVLGAVAVVGMVRPVASAPSSVPPPRSTKSDSKSASQSGQPSTVASRLNASDDQARFLAGLTAVEGPGVVVTLADGRHPVRSHVLPKDMPFLIHDTDINQTVNELKAAGAEAIAVNDQRLVATSPIRCAGPTVMVNNIPQSPPYIIRAIGNPQTMQIALKLPGGVADSLRQLNPAMFQLKAVPHLTLPAYHGNVPDRYARPVMTAAGSAEAESGSVEKVRQFVITWRVPAQGTHRYRVRLSDADGMHIVFDKACRSATNIQVPITARGSRIVFRLYDNAHLVKQQTL